LKKALVLADLFLRSAVEPADQTRKIAQETVGEKEERLMRYIYPKVIKALDNPIRRDILFLLLREDDTDRKMAFTELKKGLRGINNASLSLHLNILQQAILIERFINFSEPRTAKDPYYAFYRLSRFGKELIFNLSGTMHKSVRLLPAIAHGV